MGACGVIGMFENEGFVVYEPPLEKINRLDRIDVQVTWISTWQTALHCSTTTITTTTTTTIVVLLLLLLLLLKRNGPSPTHLLTHTQTISTNSQLQKTMSEHSWHSCNFIGLQNYSFGDIYFTLSLPSSRWFSLFKPFLYISLDPNIINKII